MLRDVTTTGTLLILTPNLFGRSCPVPLLTPDEYAYKYSTSGGYTTSDMLERSLDAGEQNKIAPNRQKSSGTGVELLGAPPDVLYLYAYSSGVSSGAGQDRPNKYGVNINKVPVVVTSLNITYPDDVDYIPTYSNGDPRKSEPFPVKMDVEISLVETHSPREYERFDLMKYKKGVLVNF